MGFVAGRLSGSKDQIALNDSRPLEDKPLITTALPQKSENNQFYNNYSSTQKNHIKPSIITAPPETKKDCHIGLEQYRLGQQLGQILEQELINQASATMDLIDFLGKNGSESTVNAIKTLANDKTLEPSVRAAAVSATDWNTDKEKLIQLLSDEENSQVKTSLISSSGRVQLEPNQREQINRLIYDNLIRETDDGVITMSLNYLSDMDDPEWSVNAYAQLLYAGTSSAVMEYITSDVNSSESLKSQFPTLLSQ
ncbi:MAG: hypothetical protein WCR46_13885 [Deltaproteobacteria bacterium]